MESRFFEQARISGHSVVDVAAMFLALPEPVRRTTCFADPIVSGVWRYDFAEPMVLESVVAMAWPDLGHLIAAAAAARRWLRPAQMVPYFTRLGDRSRHEDVLAEMVPATRFASTWAVDFEFRTGMGGHDVDWRLSPPGKRAVLIEVKRRTGDLKKLFERAGQRMQRGEDGAPRPDHDAAMMFLHVEKKLPPKDPDDQLQGAWIETTIQQDDKDLRAAFAALDPQKVHFAVLGSWTPGVHVLAHRGEDAEAVLTLFGEARDARHTTDYRRGGDR